MQVEILNKLDALTTKLENIQKLINGLSVKADRAQVGLNKALNNMGIENEK